MYRVARPATNESAGMKTVVKDEKGHKKTLSKLVALLGALVAGNLDALFLLPFELATAFDYLMAVVSVPLFALSAVVCAALGPLLGTCFALGMFRVEGGTAIAIISVFLGVPLMYWALILGLRRWWKATGRLAKWIGWIAIACYSALATYCMIEVCMWR